MFAKQFENYMLDMQLNAKQFENYDLASACSFGTGIVIFNSVQNPALHLIQLFISTYINFITITIINRAT